MVERLMSSTESSSLAATDSAMVEKAQRYQFLHRQYEQCVGTGVSLRYFKQIFKVERDYTHLYEKRNQVLCLSSLLIRRLFLVFLTVIAVNFTETFNK